MPLQAHYPEYAAGGFSRCDGTIEFYSRIRSLLSPGVRVLDFGAGRGAQHENDQSEYRRELRDLRGRAAQVIGCDVDPAIRNNPVVVPVLIAGVGPLPFPSASFDLIVADWVFEHVVNPTFTASELTRVLRSAGWLCARTPNTWNYSSVVSRIVGDRLHKGILQRAQRMRQEEDIFPTVYAMNSRRTIARLFPRTSFANLTYLFVSEPAYFQHRSELYLFCRAVHRFAPAWACGTLFLFLRKRNQAEAWPNAA